MTAATLTVAAAVAAIAACKAPDTITMNDGRLVEFPPKRKLTLNCC